MLEYISRLWFLAEVRWPASNIRATITDGIITTVSTVTGATITDQTAIGTYKASMQVQNITNIESILGNLDNLIIT